MAVRVAAGVSIAGVGRGVAVAVGRTVAVGVGSEIVVAVGTLVAVTAGGMGVAVGGRGVAVGVAVGSGAAVSAAVGTGVAVAVGVGVRVGETVGDGDGTGSAVAVGNRATAGAGSAVLVDRGGTVVGGALGDDPNEHPVHTTAATRTMDGSRYAALASGKPSSVARQQAARIVRRCSTGFGVAPTEFESVFAA